MEGANVIFSFDKVDLTIQCTKNDVMKDICQKYSNKIKKKINILIFLYGGNELNYNLKFKDVITDKKSNEMNFLFIQKKVMNLYVLNVVKKLN